MIGFDWYNAYLPALLAFIAGKSPYFGPFLNPPWILPILSPLALLPPDWGFYAIFTLNLLAFVVVMLRVRLHPVVLLALVALSGMIFSSTNGNIDGFVALGFILPAPVGLLLVLLKPQIGAGLVLYYAWIYRKDWRKLIYTFAPVTLAYMLSFAIYGNWISTGVLLHSSAQIFPLGMPFGVAFLVLALWRRDPLYTLPAGVLFSPYVNSFSWSFLWLGLAYIIQAEKSYNWSSAVRRIKGLIT